MNDVLRFILIVMAIALVPAVLGIGYVLFRLKRLNVPPNLSFQETLRRVPISLVIVLDLLDLAFDFLAAPISWWLLGRLNLQALRRVSLVEALIPGTQMVPTLTLSWFAVRIFNNDAPRTIPHDDRQG